MKRLKGKVVTHTYKSTILKSNPLKDPYVREVIIYLPPGYSESYSKGYVTVFGLAGFGGSGKTLLNSDPLGENIEARMNRLISEGKSGPMILVLVDCFTRFGGNQYINSSATGRYEDYIINEIVPFVDKTYNTSYHAVWGTSSGGYGALVLGMRHPEIFQGLVDHSGDAAFEYCYLPDFPIAIDVLRKYKGAKRWLIDFWNKASNYDKKDFTTLSIISMAAHYSPNLNNPDLYIDLPFDTESGEFKESIWKLWREFDPINKVSDFSDNLKKMKLLYFDCGINDEFNLTIGSRIFSKRCKDLGINHEYMEFEGGHFNTGYRYDTSLQQIWNAIG